MCSVMWKLCQYGTEMNERPSDEVQSCEIADKDRLPQCISCRLTTLMGNCCTENIWLLYFSSRVHIWTEQISLVPCNLFDTDVYIDILTYLANEN